MPEVVLPPSLQTLYFEFSSAAFDIHLRRFWSVCSTWVKELELFCLEDVQALLLHRWVAFDELRTLRIHTDWALASFTGVVPNDLVNMEEIEGPLQAIIGESEEFYSRPRLRICVVTIYGMPARYHEQDTSSQLKRLADAVSTNHFPVLQRLELRLVVEDCDTDQTAGF
jgi:hypothetical protein